ncbi:UDP-N-acetylmuramoyl-L-alanine--D-glutamate ligase [Diaphorobacter caeni]|uniref:UDP-N-acetylmuramoyl-L-alanine--D-glutamate ligase n=1 Tax=Diaphorobacter caeni TaxID=2784387 RepID=UPI00188E8CE8|nr:UDP-N-acetylmuramoyl-L-alanine--D-glutamate ligase [Diaphorobacter caeni]MBF5002877.1 UDP-N-acetylmuramoyl-L-alanine--D-glutamate ligase [Diaphorobacter caeni]
MSQHPFDPLSQQAAPGTPEVPEAALTVVPAASDIETSEVAQLPAISDDAAVAVVNASTDSLSVSELAQVSDEVAEVVPSTDGNLEQCEATSGGEDVTEASTDVAPEQVDTLAKPSFLGDAANFVAPTKSAAAEAAEFVARIFADVQGKDKEEADAEAAVPADAAQETDAQLQPGETSDDVEAATGQGAEVQELDTFVPELQGKRVLVLGLGASGMAMVRWCARSGADVTVADTREAPPQLASLQQELPQVRFVAGEMSADLVNGQQLDAVYRSPGLFPETIAAVVDAANAAHIKVGGELDLYALALRELAITRDYKPSVLAITGTNGKTTVTSLTALLVQCADKTVAMAGNIGPTLLGTLSKHLDEDTLPEVWVLELSSFQLDGVKGFEPTAAAVLNVTQDHLDWHGSLSAYAAAKARIFGEKGLMILNREDQMVMDMLPPPVRVKLQKPQLRPHVTFGGDMPQRPGDFGIESVSGMNWLVRAHEADETSRRGRNVQEIDLHIQRFMPADALRIRGRHNAMNALAALALAQAAGCSLAPMLFGLREYRGEPHRVEPIGIVNEVEYFDDSKGTNVGATVAALSGLGPDRRLVVILGGDGKGQDFSPLALPISRYARAVVLIGRDAPQIEAALQDTGVPMLHAASMPEAVDISARNAQPGDGVLMSPACASFDMFDNYAHRAKVFCDAVQALADDVGQVLGGQA